MAPPADCRSLASPSTGCGLPLAMCTMPSTPKASDDQPMTWRPTGPLCCGSRMVRQPTCTRSSGTSQPTLPTVPATAVRVTSMKPPGSWNQTPAPATTARPTSSRPTPSRRCSGSRSRALRPRPRATAPSAPATPSQIALTPRASAVKASSTGPGPLRTARGAGRAAGRLAGARLADGATGAAAGAGGGLLAGTPGSGARGTPSPGAPGRGRGRALAPRPRRGRRTGRHATNLGHGHTSHRDHRGACRPRPGLREHAGRRPGRPAARPPRRRRGHQRAAHGAVVEHAEQLQRRLGGGGAVVGDAHDRVDGRAASRVNTASARAGSPASNASTIARSSSPTACPTTETKPQAPCASQPRFAASSPE